MFRLRQLITLQIPRPPKGSHSRTITKRNSVACSWLYDVEHV